MADLYDGRLRMEQTGAEMKRIFEALKKYAYLLIAVLVALAISMVVILYEKHFFASNQISVGTARLFSDGAFISGVLFLIAGGVAGIMKHGGFDAINFAFGRFVNKIKTPNPRERDDEPVYDYVERKRRQRKYPFVHLLVIGGILTVLAAILSVL